MNSPIYVGRYRVIERVGRGSMGQVWRCHDEVLGRDVAVKVVQGHGSQDDPTIFERFRREAIAMAGLAHPNVVGVYDTDSDETSSYLVMELLSGPSVADLLSDEGQMSLERVARVGAQVARGLSAAHAIGITHRDIKPGNIVKHDKVTKIVDFGIARLGESMGNTLTQPATTIGTATYMSPEQARGIPVSTPSDIYSLGCLLMTMLTGKPPFSDPDPIEVARRHTSDQPPRASDRRADVPVMLDDLIDQMLRKNPAERPDAPEVAIVLASLEGRLRGEVGELSQIPSSARTPPMPDDLAEDTRIGPKAWGRWRRRGRI